MQLNWIKTYEKHRGVGVIKQSSPVSNSSSQSPIVSHSLLAFDRQEKVVGFVAIVSGFSISFASRTLTRISSSGCWLMSILESPSNNQRRIIDKIKTLESCRKSPHFRWIKARIPAKDSHEFNRFSMSF